MDTLFNFKFWIIAFILQFFSGNLIKLIVWFFPELNKVVVELLVYGIPALLVTFLACWFDSNI